MNIRLRSRSHRNRIRGGLPVALPNLALWVDRWNSDYSAPSNNLFEIDDISGYGRHLTQSTTEDQPELFDTYWQFDGVSEHLDIPLSTINDSITIALLIQYADFANISSDARVITANHPDGSSANWRVLSTSGTNWVWAVGDGSSVRAASLTALDDYDGNGWLLVFFDATDSGGFEIGIETLGVSISTDKSRNTDTSGGDVQLGHSDFVLGGTGIIYSDFDNAAVIITHDIMSSADRELLRTYYQGLLA